MDKRGESSHPLKLLREFHKNRAWQWSPGGLQEALWGFIFPSFTKPDLLTGYFCSTHLNTLTLLWINKEKKNKVLFQGKKVSLSRNVAHMGVFESLYTKRYKQKVANKSHFSKVQLFHFTLCFFISLFHDLLSAFSWSQTILIHASVFSDPIININTRGKLEKIWLYLLSARILIQESTSASASL